MDDQLDVTARGRDGDSGIGRFLPQRTTWRDHRDAHRFLPFVMAFFSEITQLWFKAILVVWGELVAMNQIARCALLPLAALLAGATPAQKVIPRPTGGPALINPAHSPVKFRGFDKDGAARFDGRFVLSGYFIYGCEFDCEGAVTEQDLVLQIVPDPDLAKRLPRWTNSGNVAIDIRQAEKLRSGIATKKQVSALLSGNMADVHGRIAIVVDDFAADFGCDYSPYYSARFVSVAEPPSPAKAQPTPGGC